MDGSEEDVEILITETEEMDESQKYDSEASETSTTDAEPSDENRPEPPKDETNCVWDESGQTNCTPPKKPDDSEPLTEGLDPGEYSEMTPPPGREPFYGEALHPTYYLIFGAFSIIIGIIVSYTVFSRFFHRRPYETFSTKGKFFGFIGVALATAVAVMLFAYFIPVWMRG